MANGSWAIQQMRRRSATMREDSAGESLSRDDRPDPREIGACVGNSTMSASAFAQVSGLLCLRAISCGHDVSAGQAAIFGPMPVCPQKTLCIYQGTTHHTSQQRVDGCTTPLHVDRDCGHRGHQTRIRTLTCVDARMCVGTAWAQAAP